MPPRGRIRRGFTLIETLVGITVLIVGFLPVYLLFVGTERRSIETVRMVRALALAHTLLEETKALPVRRIPATPRASDEDFFALVATAGGPDRHFTPLPADEKRFFARSIEVFDEGERVKRVRVTVSDLAVERDSVGHRGDLVLEALVLR